MSLVNLAHVCSHLQNASLARLSLTSIPYTKWHLSLALLLQRQGFLSHVNLGGPSPPSSLFGAGQPDNHHVSNHPHRASGRDPRSPEAALALMLRQGRDAQWLRDHGFGSEAIEFAEEHGIRSAAELVAQGWAAEVVRLVMDTRERIETLLERRVAELSDLAITESIDDFAIASPERRRDMVEAEVVALLPTTHQSVYQQYRNTPRSELEATSFPHSTLATLAGPHTYCTETDIQRRGITISVMGLQIHNQPLTLPRRLYQDPGHLEDEGIVTQQNRASRRLWLGLKYYESSPVLSKASMVSKPTKRIWLDSHELAKVVRGGRAGEVKAMTQIGEIMAISTDKGIMEARECVERRIGGMALCRIW